MKVGKKEIRHQVLARHVKRLEREIIKLQELDQRYFWIRLGVLLVGALGIYIAYQSRQSSKLLIAGLFFLIIFSFVVYFNRKVKKSILRFSLSRQYFGDQLARMDLDWAEIPLSPVDPPDEEHPFASDLDLTGAHSLHQLLNTAISQGGSYRLQNWLLNQVPDLGQVSSRQATVREIQSLSGFRSRLALSSSLVSADEDETWDGENLISWLERKVEVRSLMPLLGVLSALAAANIILFALFTLDLVPASVQKPKNRYKSWPGAWDMSPARQRAIW